MGECVGGKEHSEVITQADDPERYDPAVFAAFGFRPPNGNRWGYCVDCRQPFRWSILDIEWRPWPGGLAQLPHLSDEELELLHGAVERSGKELDEMLELAQGPGMRAELAHPRLILSSLATVIAEARYGLWPTDSPHEPRAWGEAWNVLGGWVDEQIDGIRRSSMPPASQGALSAFQAVRDKLGELGVYDKEQ